MLLSTGTFQVRIEIQDSWWASWRSSWLHWHSSRGRVVPRRRGQERTFPLRPAQRTFDPRPSLLCLLTHPLREWKNFLPKIASVKERIDPVERVAASTSQAESTLKSAFSSLFPTLFVSPGPTRWLLRESRKHWHMSSHRGSIFEAKEERRETHDRWSPHCRSCIKNTMGERSNEGISNS